MANTKATQNAPAPKAAPETVSPVREVPLGQGSDTDYFTRVEPVDEDQDSDE